MPSRRMDLVDLRGCVQAHAACGSDSQEPGSETTRVGGEVVVAEQRAAAAQAISRLDFTLLQERGVEAGAATCVGLAAKRGAVEHVAGEVQRVAIDLVRADTELPRPLAQRIDREPRATPHALGFLATCQCCELREGLVEFVLDQGRRGDRRAAYRPRVGRRLQPQPGVRQRLGYQGTGYARPDDECIADNIAHQRRFQDLRTTPRLPDRATGTKVQLTGVSHASVRVTR